MSASAFKDCDSLTSVTLPKNLTNVDSEAFRDCDSLIWIDVAGGNTAFTAVDGILFRKDMTMLCVYPAGKTAASYTVPSSVTKIGDSAMYNCDNLTSVTLPASLTVLDDYALCDCDALKTVTILAKSPSVSFFAFDYCPVETVNYAGSEDEWNASEWKDAFNSSATVTYNYSALSVTTQPKDATGAVGDTATFTVKAAGSGLTYQWYMKKSGESTFTAWNGKTSASVSTPIYASWDGAQFYCLVRSGGSSVKSNTVKLTVNPIKITKQPANASGVLNATATFSVTATGDTLSYQWYMKKSGDSSFTAWNKKTSASVSTPIYQSWHNAQFYCLVKDDKGHSMKTNTVKLTVVPIQITKQPVSVSGAVNTTATFSVTASGSNLTYQWYMKKASDSSFTAWNKKTTASVSTPIYQSWHNAQFYCLVKDDKGNSLKSNTVKLTVAPIQISKQPVSVSGAVNGTATFSVTATGSNLTYQWYLKKTSDSSFTAWNKKTTASVSTTVYASWQGAQFYCLVKDDKGNSLKSNTVKLTVTPKITQQPANASGAVGDTATFTVKATGAGLTYQWYRKKSGESTFTVWNDKTSASVSTPIYQSWDGAQFYCLVKGGGSSVKSNTVKLTVNPIAITKQPASASGVVNGTATFSVTATGSNLTYQWYVKKASDSAFSAWNKKTTASVSTTIYQSWDGAQFYCLVKDDKGNSVKSNTVKLTVVPIAITKQPVNASGAVNATATFSVTASGSNLTYQWYYKKSGESSFTAWNKRTEASVSTPIYNSWDGAQFYCLVKDDKGNSVKSNTVKLTVK